MLPFTSSFLAQASTTAQTVVPAQTPLLNGRALVLVAVVLVALTCLVAIGQYIKRQPEANVDQAIIRNFNKRVTSWLIIFVLLVVSVLLNNVVIPVVLFGLVSFWALREFITMTPTRSGDHRTLFWVILGFTPLQYVLVGLNYYELFTVVIPCLLYTSPSPRDQRGSRMPSSA